MTEPPGPHDPDRKVIHSLLRACPSFEGAWSDDSGRSANDDEGAYTEVAAFAHHLVALLERAEVDEFPAVFGAVEELVRDPDAGIRYLATSGLLEDLGNIGANADGWSFANRFSECSDQRPRNVGAEIHRMWGTSQTG